MWEVNIYKFFSFHILQVTHKFYILYPFYIPGNRFIINTVLKNITHLKNYYPEYILNFQRKDHSGRFNISGTLVIWFPSQKLILLHLWNCHKNLIPSSRCFQTKRSSYLYEDASFSFHQYAIWWIPAVSSLKSKSLTSLTCLLLPVIRWKRRIATQPLVQLNAWQIF